MRPENSPLQLQGKTGLDESYEKELIRRIEEIENQGSVVDPLTSTDWIITFALILFVGIAPVIYYAIIL